MNAGRLRLYGKNLFIFVYVSISCSMLHHLNFEVTVTWENGHLRSRCGIKTADGAIPEDGATNGPQVRSRTLPQIIETCQKSLFISRHIFGYRLYRHILSVDTEDLPAYVFNQILQSDKQFVLLIPCFP